MLKGPTGCGKTRFVEHMAWRLGRPLVTVACHDDLSASDLVGRYLVRAARRCGRTARSTRAVRAGALCYLDEVVEARQDTIVVIHPLTDDRRILPIDKTGELLRGAARVPARRLLQPRLPARPQGPQAEHAAALRRARLRRSRRPSSRRASSPTRAASRPAIARRAREPGRPAAPAARPRAAGGAEHPAARRGGAPHRQRHARTRGVPRGSRRPADRRPRAARRHPRRDRRRARRAAVEPEGLLIEGARRAAVAARELWWRARPPAGARRPAAGAREAASRARRRRALRRRPRRSSRATRRPGRRGSRACSGARPRHLVSARRARPSTDGVSVWLPRALEIGDDEQARAVATYRLLALEQAARAVARHAAPPPPSDRLERDLYALAEAVAVDRALARELGGPRGRTCARPAARALRERPALERLTAAGARAWSAWCGRPRGGARPRRRPSPARGDARGVAPVGARHRGAAARHGRRATAASRSSRSGAS